MPPSGEKWGSVAVVVPKEYGNAFARGLELVFLPLTKHGGHGRSSKSAREHVWGARQTSMGRTKWPCACYL